VRVEEMQGDLVEAGGRESRNSSTQVRAKIKAMARNESPGRVCDLNETSPRR